MVKNSYIQYTSAADAISVREQASLDCVHFTARFPLLVKAVIDNSARARRASARYGIWALYSCTHVKGELSLYSCLCGCIGTTSLGSAVLFVRLQVDVPNIYHAFQTAERIREQHPDQDWFHLVGLIHDLGKVMAIWGDPQVLKWTNIWSCTSKYK